jgi:hypothetical protein
MAQQGKAREAIGIAAVSSFIGGMFSALMLAISLIPSHRSPSPSDLPTQARSSVVGLVVGAVPGAGADIAAFVSYAQGRTWSRHRADFGNGSPLRHRQRRDGEQCRDRRESHSAFDARHSRRRRHGDYPGNIHDTRASARTDAPREQPSTIDLANMLKSGRNSLPANPRVGSSTLSLGTLLFKGLALSYAFFHVATWWFSQSGHLKKLRENCAIHVQLIHGCDNIAFEVRD